MGNVGVRSKNAAESGERAHCGGISSRQGEWGVELTGNCAVYQWGLGGNVQGITSAGDIPPDPVECLQAVEEKQQRTRQRGKSVTQ